MHWRDEVIAGFPSPDDREPGSLRGDIADELADHLACAMQRELRRTDDEIVARKKVFERFGNVKAITRRLWWDAMRYRIMKDRLFLVGTFIVMIALVAAVVMPWAAKQNEINAAILAKLEQIVTQPPSASRPTVLENWSNLRVRVVEGETDTPRRGFEVTLEGKAFSDSIVLRERTSNTGEVIFGPIQPGVYELRANHSRSQLTYNTTVTLYAGRQLETLINCPSRPEPASLVFRVTPAEALDRAGAVVACDLQPAVLQVGSSEWYARSLSLVIHPDGRIISEGYNGPTPLPIEHVFHPQQQFAPVAPVTYRLRGVRVCTTTIGARGSRRVAEWAADYQRSVLSDLNISTELKSGQQSVINITIPDLMVKWAEEQRNLFLSQADEASASDEYGRGIRDSLVAARIEAVQSARNQGNTEDTRAAIERIAELERRFKNRGEVGPSQTKQAPEQKRETVARIPLSTSPASQPAAPASRDKPVPRRGAL